VINGPVFKSRVWEVLQQVAGDDRQLGSQCRGLAPKPRARPLPYSLGKGCCTEIGVMPMAYVAFSLVNHWSSVSVSLKKRFFHVSRTWPFFHSHAV
jgi:hypothetical protein